MNKNSFNKLKFYKIIVNQELTISRIKDELAHLNTQKPTQEFSLVFSLFPLLWPKNCKEY